MKTILNRTAVVATLYAALLTLPAMGGVIYNSIPSPQPPNVYSLGYEATQTKEFGNLINFAGTYRDLTSVTVLMSDWALAPTLDSPPWNMDLTLNLYNNSGPIAGPSFASRTQTFAIPWRPVADPTCADQSQWKAGNGSCYSGFAFTVAFDFTGTTVPDQIIYGLAFNTQTAGYHPTGTEGPYNFLNFGLAVAGPSVGSDVVPTTAYWNTAYAPFYTDGGTGGVGIFRLDTAWEPYSGAVTFDAVPEPATCLLFGTGLLCMGLVRRRRRAKTVDGAGA